MPAQTLNCPMCGAPTATEAANCAHCGARLATVSCPVCFGLMFLGEKFCSHCGTAAARAEIAPDNEFCPRCKTKLESVQVGKTHLDECPQCQGLWVDKDTLQQICDNAEEQESVLGLPTQLPDAATPNVIEPIRYIPCPICQQLMNRVNFANCSNVIVDVCRTHGTWFDRDELHRLVEFIRGGGMKESREREIQELEQRRRLARIETITPNVPMGLGDLNLGSARNNLWMDLGISAASLVLRALLK